MGDLDGEGKSILNVITGHNLIWRYVISKFHCIQVRYHRHHTIYSTDFQFFFCNIFPGLGTAQIMGHMDFYPNSGHPPQPGCVMSPVDAWNMGGGQFTEGT